MTTVKYKAESIIKSRVSDYQEKLEFFVIPKITNSLPSNNIDISQWLIPHNIILADPDFNISNEIDALLGTEIFFKILKERKLKINGNMPFIQDTTFGWILCGKYEESNRTIEQI